MKRRNTEPIANLIAQFLRQEGLETPLAQHRAVEAWPSVVGENFASLTQDVTVRGQTLHVHVKSAVARHELMVRRDELLEKLNLAAGAHILYEIRFA